jgi:hypothetical protein
MVKCTRCDEQGRTWQLDVFGRTISIQEPYCDWHAALMIVAMHWEWNPVAAQEVYDASAGRMGPGLKTYQSLRSYVLKCAVQAIIGSWDARQYLRDDKHEVTLGKMHRARCRHYKLIPGEA